MLARLNSRQFFTDEPEKPVLVFTDGAVETHDRGEVEATVGGVIFVKDKVHGFGAHVDDEVLREGLSESSHPVGLAEL